MFIAEIYRMAWDPVDGNFILPTTKQKTFGPVNDVADNLLIADNCDMLWNPVGGIFILFILQTFPN